MIALLEEPVNDLLLCTLALSQAPGIGPIRFKLLCEHFGSAVEVFNADRTAVREALGNFKNPDPLLFYLDHTPKPEDFVAELEFIEREDRSLIAFGEVAYPELLSHIPDPPPLLYVWGNSQTLQTPQLAVVGSRKASTAGQRRSLYFAKAISNLGITITSGLAHGIDAAAHQGALSDGGVTIAVLGSGLDRVYPKAHTRLAEKIADSGGALVSEQAPAAAPHAKNFPKRNRIISGLSLGTLVIEASRRSGSLITARMAAEQGREVFAVPGDIDNPNSRGCHWLLRQGAALIEEVDDLLTPLAPQLKHALNDIERSTAADNNAERTAQSGNKEELILGAMGFSSKSIDELCSLTQLTSGEVSTILLSLELSGKVTGQTGGTFCRT